MKKIRIILFILFLAIGIALFFLDSWPMGVLAIVTGTFFIHRWIPAALIFNFIILNFLLLAGGPTSGDFFSIGLVLLAVLVVFVILALIVGKLIQKKSNGQTNEDKNL